MILFWLICAGLAAIALAFVLPTLLQLPAANSENNKTEANVEIYRDQLRELEADLANGIVSPEQYRQDRDEIERRLLDDVADSSVLRKQASPAPSQRAVVYAVAFGIPVVAVVLYLLIGTSAALSGVPPQTATAGNVDAARMTQQGVEANVAVLAKRLEQNPNDADGWTLLGRSYIILEKYREASDAYAKASALKSQDADILVHYAFALAMANNRQLQGKPTDLIKRALQIAPENPQALELAGEAEFEARNYKQAIAYWQRVLEKSTGDAQLTKAISERINEAKSLAAAASK
ncbi:MAG TPA: c-type cytochrome biogenesis protein CcmI [Pyrinomonadaceae bacterium]|nr:c-type cytochrome biogenesis protein CcmI [Pyrinomonadaceae bacterium]